MTGYFFNLQCQNSHKVLNSTKALLIIILKYTYIQKGILLNGFSGCFGLSLPADKCLLDNFIESFPWCNVPEECTIKENSVMISDSNSYPNGHLVPKMIIKFLYLYDHT